MITNAIFRRSFNFDKDFLRGSSGSRTKAHYSAVMLILLGLLMHVGCKKVRSDKKIAMIVGGSMAPHFLCKHIQLRCDDCGIGFDIDLETAPDDKVAVCPNCGFSEVKINPVTRDLRYIVTKGTQVNRWDAVAIYLPNSMTQGIKRVVGMPGENVSIERGRVRVNGKVATRTFEQMRWMKILVYDDKFRAGKEGEAFTPMKTPANTHWLSYDGGWKYEPELNADQNADQSSMDDFLVFQPFHTFKGNSRTPARGVLDSYGYNQNTKRQKLNEVPRLVLTFLMDANTGSKLAVVCQDSDGFSKVVLHVGPSRKPNTKLEDIVVEPGKTLVEFSTINSAPILRINGEEVELDNRVEKVPSLVGVLGESVKQLYPNSTFGFQAEGVVDLSGLVLERDIYYVERGKSEFQLGEDEYLVLGDNSPISNDGRHWAPSGIKKRRIIGVVNPDDVELAREKPPLKPPT